MRNLGLGVLVLLHLVVGLHHRTPADSESVVLLDEGSTRFPKYIAATVPTEASEATAATHEALLSGEWVIHVINELLHGAIKKADNLMKPAKAVLAALGPAPPVAPAAESVPGPRPRVQGTPGPPETKKLKSEPQTKAEMAKNVKAKRGKVQRQRPRPRPPPPPPGVPAPPDVIDLDAPPTTAPTKAPTAAPTPIDPTVPTPRPTIVPTAHPTQRPAGDIVASKSPPPPPPPATLPMSRRVTPAPTGSPTPTVEKKKCNCCQTKELKYMVRPNCRPGEARVEKVKCLWNFNYCPNIGGVSQPDKGSKQKGGG